MSTVQRSGVSSREQLNAIRVSSYCKDCGEKFEQMRMPWQPTAQVCPVCMRAKLETLSAVVSVAK